MMPNANAPRFTARPRTDHADIAAQVDETAVDLPALQQPADAIDGIFLHHAAEIELHSRHEEP